MTGELQRVLETIEGQFDAAVARDEENAANDLAISLHQERSLVSAVTSAGAAFLSWPGGVRTRVSAVGADYLETGAPARGIWRLDRVTVQLRAEGSPPARRQHTFLQALRLWAREVRQVEVVMPGDSFTGRLTRTGRDHLVLAGSGGRRIVPFAVVTAVKLVHGD